MHSACANALLHCLPAGIVPGETAHERQGRPAQDRSDLDRSDHGAASHRDSERRQPRSGFRLHHLSLVRSQLRVQSVADHTAQDWQGVRRSPPDIDGLPQRFAEAEVEPLGDRDLRDELPAGPDQGRWRITTRALDRLVAAEQKGTTLEGMRAAGLFAEARAARDEWENRCDTLTSIRARVSRLLAQNGLAVPRSGATPWYRIRRNTDL